MNTSSEVVAWTHYFFVITYKCTCPCYSSLRNSKNRYCNLKILCDLDNKKLNLESKKYKNIILTDNAKNIFKDDSIDLVSIASYDNFHYDQVISCLNANKHFFVEKPLCVNEIQLKKIKKYYDLSNGKIHFSSNFVLRGNSIFKHIKI